MEKSRIFVSITLPYLSNTIFGIFERSCLAHGYPAAQRFAPKQTLPSVQRAMYPPHTISAVGPRYVAPTAYCPLAHWADHRATQVLCLLWKKMGARLLPLPL